MRPPDDLTAWARLLRSAGGHVPPVGTRLGAGLIDEVLLGCLHNPSAPKASTHRASIHRASIQAASIQDAQDASPGGAPAAQGGLTDHDDAAADLAMQRCLRPEERIWRWVDNDDPELESLLMLGDGPLLPPPVPIGGLKRRAFAAAEWAKAGWPVQRWTIETWTEGELSALQATLHRACGPGGDRWHRRIGSARRWHLEHTQPDNATNRPWAIPVFLAPSVVGATAAIERSPEHEVEVAESRLYAETLLHNAMSQAFGAPNPLCAAILHDAANLLDRMA